MLARWSSCGGCLGLAAILLVSAQGGAQTTHPVPLPFLDVRWGHGPDSVIAAARHAGWSFVTIDEDGDYAFRGAVGDVGAVVFATFGDSGLSRVTVSLDPHPLVAATFQQVRDSLIARYGPAALATDDDGPWRPAPGLFVASAWRGILMGLRRDGRILVVFTCPAATPRLPIPRVQVATRAAPE